VPLHRTARPLVQPELGRRHLYLVSYEPDCRIGQLAPAAREPTMPHVELQQQSDPEPPSASLTCQQRRLVVQHRSVLNQLVEFNRSIHGPQYFPTP